MLVLLIPCNINGPGKGSKVNTVDPRISEGNGTEPPLDMQNLRICKNMNIIKT